MSWNWQRACYALLVATGGALATLGQSQAFDPRIAMWVIFAASIVNGFLQVLGAPSSSLSSGPKVPPLPVFAFFLRAIMVLSVAYVFGAILLACSWFSSNKQALVPVEVSVCVFGATEAGMKPDEAALFCKVSVDVVNQLLEEKRQKALEARAAAHRVDGGP